MKMEMEIPSPDQSPFPVSKISNCESFNDNDELQVSSWTRDSNHD